MCKREVRLDWYVYVIVRCAGGHQAVARLYILQFQSTKDASCVPLARQAEVVTQHLAILKQ